MLQKLLLAAFWVCALAPGLAQAQSTIVRGTVTDPDGDPLIGANIVIENLVLGSSTDLDGTYSFEVPSQFVGRTVTLTARYIGFSPQTRDITLTSGTMTEDFTLSADLLNLDEVVVTGVTDATPQKKLSFTVAKVSGDALEQAPGNSPVESMQGKVAGAQVIQNTGEPGSGFSVRLRGATSITGSSEPLYIVDGVILGADQVDIGSLDIESIEVVKGAAASSLYGSRAQAGVVQITTKRGTQVPYNTTRVTIRNEFGVSTLARTLGSNSAHNLRVNEQGQFLTTVEGNAVVNNCATCLDSGYGPGTLVDTELGGVSFYDNPYALSGATYDNFDEFFDPGNTYTNYISVSQNSARTNFHLSFSNLHQDGVIRGISGYDQRAVRLNVDHRLRDDLTLSATGFYSASDSDEAGDDANFDPFYTLFYTNPLVNLSETDPETGDLRVKADPLALEENPLYLVENQLVNRKRSRVLGNFRGRYSPVDWVNLEANFSYDRLDRDGLDFYDRGFDTIDPSAVNDGRVERRSAIFEALNADLTASFQRTFGRMTARSQLKYQVENADTYTQAVFANSLVAEGINDLDNIEQPPDGTRDLDSFESTIRSESYYATAGVDYADRYIADFLVRRDGSSLFGADERWQTYFRVSGAYRISEEPWWPIKDAVDEFKLRYSLGTAGGRPGFEYQYETFVLNNGNISKGTLGNRQLKPELSTEQEFGLEASLFGRVFLEAVYATTDTEDQLLRVPLAGPFGFSAQWQNAGALSSNTIEVSLSSNLLQRRDMSLNVGLIFDRTNQEITEFNVNAFRGGPQTAFYFRADEVLGAMYGTQWLEGPADLPAGYSAAAFDVNDDGYYVPVGEGNSWQNGFDGGCEGGDGGCWGTLVDVDGDGSGDLQWGIPVKFTEEDGNQFVQIGNVLPDFNLGFNTSFRYKGLSAYMLWNAQVGGDVYNYTRQYSYRDGRAADQDQTGLPDAEKKPASYYERLYDATAISSAFIEDGTYVKLRELSLGYTFDRAQLRSVFGDVLHSVSINLIGRNLLTFTDYTGFDPEVGNTASNANVGGDASLYRVDSFTYPRFRTVTGKLEIQF